MATVADLLDRLAAGELTVEDVVADFRARTWSPPRSRTSADHAQLGVDPQPYDPDSWDVVNADSRLTSDVYGRLAAAYKQARQTHR